MPRTARPLRLLAAGLLLLLGAPARAEWTDWIAEGDVAFQYDTNLNQSGYSSDEEWDVSWHPVLRLGRVYQLADNTRLHAVAEIRGDIYHDFNELDTVAGDGELSLVHKFGLGDAPWARLFYRGGYQGVQALQRSGPLFEVGLETGKRFSPRFDASFRYRYTNRIGNDGPVAVPAYPDDVFTMQYHMFTLEGRFLVTERLQARAGFTYRRGDFTSNAQTNKMLALRQENVKAVSMDTVFGGWVYRILGNIYVASVGLNYGFSDHFSLDLDYHYQYGAGDWLDYASNRVRLTAIYRY